MDKCISMREPPRLIKGCGDARMRLVQPTEMNERVRDSPSC